MDQNDKELKRARENNGSSPNRRKHVKLNKFKGRALKTMDSTSFTHSFSFIIIRREWNTLKMKEITIN